MTGKTRTDIKLLHAYILQVVMKHSYRPYVQRRGVAVVSRVVRQAVSRGLSLDRSETEIAI